MESYLQQLGITSSEEHLLSNWRIRVRNKNFQFVGEISRAISLAIELKYNEVSKWVLTLDATQKGAQLFYDHILSDPNNGGIGGVYIERNGYFILSGPVIDAEEAVSKDGGEVLILYGNCDMDWIDTKLALPHPRKFQSPNMNSGSPNYYHTDTYPQPSDPPGNYFASAHIWHFVSRNIGQNADASRKLPFLNVINRNNGYAIPRNEESKGRGDNLLQLCQGICDYSEYKGKPLQILCRQYWNGSNWEIRFETVEPVLAPNAIMSKPLGTITEYLYRRQRPSANQILMGGSGEGKNRVFAYAGDEPSKALYGRIEAFEEFTGEINTKDTDPTYAKELQVLSKELQARLTEAAEQTIFTFKFQETKAVQYGRDFVLGNKVRVYLKRTSTTDIVRSVRFRVERKQEEIEIGVGKQNVIYQGLRLFDRIKKLEYRYNGLTKRTLGE